LEALAEEIDLSGTITGPDSGLSREDILDLAARTSNVTGTRAGGTSVSAAFGVHEAVQATAAALGSPVNELHLVVQGLGSLGAPLAEQLAKEGAQLTVTDQDHRRIDLLLSALTPGERRQVGVVAPYQALDVEADILVPCAVGGLLDTAVARTLKCRAICGGANNQLVGSSLAEELDAARALHDAGVLFVPDWLASAGGTIHGTMEARDGDEFDLRKAHARIRRVCGWMVDELLERAKRTGRVPLEMAVERWLP
jgi:leucine dehydrogenase